MRVDSIQGNRFFARVKQFELECPTCGRVYGINKKNLINLKEAVKATYNFRTARFTCLHCGKRYTVGLVLWSNKTNKDSVPPDQIPNPRQASDLRAIAGGVWPTDRRVNKGDSNIVINRECTCGICPVHCVVNVSGQGKGKAHKVGERWEGLKRGIE